MDSIIKLRCYAFWLWEYTRRNPEYRKAYAEYTKLPGTGISRFVSIGLDRVPVPGSHVEIVQQFYAKFLMFPKDPDERLGSNTRATTAEEILDYYARKPDNEEMRMVPGDFDKNLAPPIPTGLTVLGYSLPNINLRYRMDDRVPQSDPSVTFALDLSKDIEMVRLELEYQYYQHKLINESRSSNFDREKLFAEYMSQVDRNLPEEQRQEQITEFGKRLDEWTTLKSEEKRAEEKILLHWCKRTNVNESANPKRAIGLWLCDTVSPKQSVYKLTRLFREKYPILCRQWPADADGNAMFRSFENYHKVTTACVESRKILPITTKTARKAET